MFDTVVILSVLAGLLAVIGVCQPLAARLRLPSSVLLAAIGVAIGVSPAAVAWIGQNPSHTVTLWADLPIRSETFIYVFLPMLVFEAGIVTDVRRTVADAAAILILAVVVTIFTMAVIGLALWPLAPVPLTVCLLLGAIVATTDPAAVIAIFRDVGAPVRLTRLVEGEALLNDAAAIALFVVLLGMITRGGEPDIAAGLREFIAAFLGGGVVGLLAGRVLLWAMARVGEDRLAEATLSVAFAYLTFIAAEQAFHVSGIVAVLAMGLTLSALGRARIAPENWTSLVDLWDQIAFWARSLIFVLAAILVPRLLVDIGWRDLVLLAVLIAAAFGARSFGLFVLLPPLEYWRLTQRIETSYKLAIIWGGLRGALTLVLALAVTESDAISDQVQRFVAVLATGFVLFTLFVNGTTLRRAIGFLGLDRLSPREAALRDHVLALSYTEAREAAQEIARTHELAPPIVEPVIAVYDARLAAIRQREGLAVVLTERDRLSIALVALANQEWQLALDVLASRIASPAAVQMLLAGADALADAARSDGRIGYQRASQGILELSVAYRAAYWLYRRFGLPRPLAVRLGERVEKLLVLRFAVQRLVRFNANEIALVFGDRIGELAGHILDRRRAAIVDALDVLRRQFPEYLAELEARFLRQSTLRHEMVRYQNLFEEGLISQEIFQTLKLDTLGARALGRRQRRPTRRRLTR